MRALLVAALAVSVLASGAAAQSWGLTGELTLGAGKGVGGTYRWREVVDARAAVSLTRKVSTATAAFMTLDAHHLEYPWAKTLDCIMVPGTNSCIEDFPAMTATGLTGGVEWRPWAFLHFRAGAGGELTRVNQERTHALTGSIDGGVVIQRFTFIAGTRLIVVPDYRSDRLSIASFILGARMNAARW